MGSGQSRIRSCKRWIQDDGVLEEFPSPRIVLWGKAAIQLCCAHEQLPGLLIRRVWASDVLFLRHCQLDLQRARYLPGDFLLHGEDVVQIPIVSLSPHVIA